MEPTVSLQRCIEVLETRRQAVQGELNGFARPIAACDVDFATLLEEQHALARALEALRPLARGTARIAHPRDGH
jgi:hypothetical protein